MPRPPVGVFDLFSDAPADHSPEGLAVASSIDPCLALPEHGPCLVGSTITLDDPQQSWRPRNFWLCGASGHWLPTDFHSTRCFGSHTLGWGGIHRVRAEMRLSFVGGLGESAPSQNFEECTLKNPLLRESEPACSLAVWACAVPLPVMQHAALLERDSWMCFTSRSYHSLPPRPSDQRVFDKLELVHHARPARLRN